MLVCLPVSGKAWKEIYWTSLIPHEIYVLACESAASGERQYVNRGWM